MRTRIFVALSALLLLAGCMPLPPEAAPLADLEALTPAPAIHIPAFEATACPFTLPPDEVEGKTVQCGFVTVPLKRSEPGAGEVKLAIVVFKSTAGSPKPDPVMLLAGGPGEKTVASAVNALYIMSPFRATRDVIVFDQRGVGLSQPALECPEVIEAVYADIGNADPEKSLRNSFAATMACRDRLVAEGHDLSAYNTAENAADVDDIWKALGYEKVNLYGGSYGSLLAQAVMRDHPEGLRSVVMGAVLPLDKSFFVHVPTTTVNAALRLVDACAADAACNQAYPNLKQVLFDTVERLNAHPVSIKITDPTTGKTYDDVLTGDGVFGNLVNFLYLTEIIPVLPQAVYDVAQGDYDLMSRLTSTIFLLLGASTRGMQWSVLCAEDLVGMTPEKYLAIRAEMPPELAGMADPEDIIEYSFFGICENWPVKQVDASQKHPVQSDLPALLLVGELDPVTPFSYAQEVVKHLPNGHAYEFPGIGHTVLVSSDCARKMATSFIEDPTAPIDESCLAGMKGVAFDLPKAESGEITPEAFEDEERGMVGVAPSGWEQPQPGVFLRKQTSLDSTALVYDRLPMDVPSFEQLIAAQLKLPASPKQTGELEAGGKNWTLYQETVQGIVVDMAVAALSGQDLLLVLMQSAPEEREALYRAVFLPALASYRVTE
jgi:pimeloyl-ACP methyl ester carboxylesterase